LGVFAIGDIVVSSFPFSNLAGAKKRPALVLAIGDFDDLVLCQITSFSDNSLNTIVLGDSSFKVGGLPFTSYARPDKLFTADHLLVSKPIAKLNKPTIDQIKTKLRGIFQI